MILRHGTLRGLRNGWLEPSGRTTQRRFLSDTNGNVASSKESESVVENVRGLMRLIPHPLTVIVAHVKRKGSLPAGLLVSSFNTVTLHPNPYVSFNLKLPSSTYDAIKVSKTFTASAVADAQLAEDFLLDKRAETYPDTLWRNLRDQRTGMLKPGRGALWWMRCRWMKKKSQLVGDHVIIVGRVEKAGYYIKSDEQGRISEKPLIYSEGQYRNAGPPAVTGKIVE